MRAVCRGPLIARVYLSAGIEQKSNDLRLRPAQRPPSAASMPASSARLGFAPAPISLRTISTFGIRARQGEGSNAVGIGGVHVGFGLDQERNDFEILGSNSPMQRRGAIRQLGIRVFGSRADQCDDVRIARRHARQRQSSPPMRPQACSTGANEAGEQESSEFRVSSIVLPTAHAASSALRIIPADRYERKPRRILTEARWKRIESRSGRGPNSI